MTSDQVTGLLRSILMLVGGVFVSKGIASPDVVNWGVGGILSAFAMGWSLWSNRPAALVKSTNALTGVNVTANSTASTAVKDATKTG